MGEAEIPAGRAGRVGVFALPTAAIAVEEEPEYKEDPPTTLVFTLRPATPPNVPKLGPGTRDTVNPSNDVFFLSSVDVAAIGDEGMAGPLLQLASIGFGFTRCTAMEGNTPNASTSSPNPLEVSGS